ncbi:MAG: glycosyltransferase family 4 protein [Bacteroidota bacterium]|nr:glycosyltransferase family 4 protein [Bacteroidota bacterium]
MNVTFVTIFDGHDIRNWSGTEYYLSKVLEQQEFELNYIGHLRTSLYHRMKRRLRDRVGINRYLEKRDPLVVKNYARQINRQLAELKTDLIFSPSSVPVSLLSTNKPIVFCTDAIFAGMIDFYDEFTNLSPKTIRNGHQMEQSAFDRCSLAIVSSQWAADVAIKNYDVSPEKIKVVPFGANIECSRTIDDIRGMVESRSTQFCSLTFIGYDWKRKGGDIAFAVVQALNQAGLPSELNIIGCDPFQEDAIPPSYVHVYGKLNKESESDMELYGKVVRKSHFLIMPSRAEAYGLVFCEANSFGVPCIASNVGGIPTIIKDNVNGMKFPPNSAINQYVAYITSVFANYERYKDMAFSSFHEYETRLNWNVAGKTIKKLLLQLS